MVCLVCVEPVVIVSAAVGIAVDHLRPKPTADARNGGLPLATPPVAVRGFLHHRVILGRGRHTLAVLKKVG